MTCRVVFGRLAPCPSKLPRSLNHSTTHCKSHPSDGGSSAEDEEEDEDAPERREALAAVRSLPLAERLALMASGAMHDEGSGLATGRRRRQRQQGLEAAEDGAKGKGTKKEKEQEGGTGVLAKPKNKHAPTEVSSKKPVPRLRALTALPPAAPTGGGRRRKARGACMRWSEWTGGMDGGIAWLPCPCHRHVRTHLDPPTKQTRASTRRWARSTTSSSARPMGSWRTTRRRRCRHCRYVLDCVVSNGWFD